MIVAFLKSFLYAMVIGTLLYFVGEALPRKWFNAEKFPYRPFKWERNGKLYDLVQVKKWKDRAPDMSKIRKKMVPKRLGIAPKSAQVYRLIRETCVAEFVHVVLALLGLVIPVFWDGHLFSGWILTIGYILGNLAFVIIQRYNRPMLLSLAKRLEIREERQRNHAKDTLAESSDPVG